MSTLDKLKMNTLDILKQGLKNTLKNSSYYQIEINGTDLKRHNKIPQSRSSYLRNQYSKSFINSYQQNDSIRLVQKQQSKISKQSHVKFYSNKNTQYLSNSESLQQNRKPILKINQKVIEQSINKNQNSNISSQNQKFSSNINYSQQSKYKFPFQNINSQSQSLFVGTQSYHQSYQRKKPLNERMINQNRSITKTKQKKQKQKFKQIRKIERLLDDIKYEIIKNRSYIIHGLKKLRQVNIGKYLKKCEIQNYHQPNQTQAPQSLKENDKNAVKIQCSEICCIAHKMEPPVNKPNVEYNQFFKMRRQNVQKI